MQKQLGPIPRATLIACIGPQTARDAAAEGLHVDVVADSPSATALIEALVGLAPRQL